MSILIVIAVLIGCALLVGIMASDPTERVPESHYLMLTREQRIPPSGTFRVIKEYAAPYEITEDIDGDFPDKESAINRGWELAQHLGYGSFQHSVLVRDSNEGAVIFRKNSDGEVCMLDFSQPTL